MVPSGETGLLPHSGLVFRSDIEKLRKIVVDARTGVSVRYLDALKRCFLSSPLWWTQRPPYGELRSTSDDFSGQDSTSSSLPLWPSEFASERDNDSCVLIRMPPEAAQIFPCCLIDPKPARGIEQCIPWKLLKFFFEDNFCSAGRPRSLGTLSTRAVCQTNATTEFA